jgi:hypothetical protein
MAVVMSAYTPDQIRIIRHAVAAGREATRAQRDFSPLAFARIYVAHEGVQLPGDFDGPRRAEVARRLLTLLQQGETSSDDGDLQRELHRARTEARWAEAAVSDKVVGFRLQLGGEAAKRPECLALLSTDRGLGAAVFRKAEVVILPPGCGGAEFIPVGEDEIEQ